MNTEEAWAEVLQLEREMAKIASDLAKKRRRLRALMHFIRVGDDEAAQAVASEFGDPQGG